MKKHTIILRLITTLILALSLAACSQINDSDPENSSINNGANETVPSNNDNGDEAANDEKEGDHAVTDPALPEPRPETKTFVLSLEGMEEEKEAKLFHGEGYSLYVFDIFNFDADSNRLSMDYDENYNVEIVKLAPDYNLDQIRTEAEDELSDLGEVKEITGDELSEQMLEPSLYLFSRSSDLTNKIIVKEVDGTSYMFKVNLPHGEALEGFSPHANTSLNSIVNE